MIARNFIAYLLQTPEQKTNAPVETGCGGLVKQAKQGGRTSGSRCVCTSPARRYPAAGRSEDEWFGMQLTVSSSGFCLLAVARCRLEGGPHMLPDIRLQQAGWKTRQTMLERNVR
jgi:hypothetical protein